LQQFDGNGLILEVRKQEHEKRGKINKDIKKENLNIKSGTSAARGRTFHRKNVGVRELGCAELTRCICAKMHRPQIKKL
jgi:hypothetical protein